jgi:hypothetical protein
MFLSLMFLSLIFRNLFSLSLQDFVNIISSAVSVSRILRKLGNRKLKNNFGRSTMVIEVKDVVHTRGTVALH